MATASSEKPDCYKCKCRGPVPGDAHSCCTYPGTNTGIMGYFSLDNAKLREELNIVQNEHGVSMGWCSWPVNFDPIWIDNCNGFDEYRKED